MLEKEIIVGAKIRETILLVKREIAQMRRQRREIMQKK